ncbi:hypothetical protein K443DRAFT_212830 [Laccaria amethystina LaAM-08-1]|uniref:Uncharacterized protein n=1 Tax=Laccaria amethystina LaAM-08-1 TaxID=1095629 RepID=A0A0C9X9Y9_9AGAR|nr:hypothetical protein K443DRAFT_212830 [Laccaria amethystina LaAM-08-1]
MTRSPPTKSQVAAETTPTASSPEVNDTASRTSVHIIPNTNTTTIMTISLFVHRIAFPRPRRRSFSRKRPVNLAFRLEKH